MNELTRQISIVLRTIWQRRWLAMAVAWATAVVLALMVWVIPNRYEATAKLFVDTQSVLKPLMAGLAFQPDLDQQVRMLAKTLLSRPNIERLMGDPGVGLGTLTDLKREQAIDRLTARIKVEHSGCNLYLIS
jgi:uncharacterized protein involved in exopolysaccharide biosynthesis